MSDSPTYPPPPPPPPDGVAGRPGAVTAAGALLIVGGGLGILFSLLFFVAGSVAAFFAVIGIFLLAVGALEIYAGTQVLALRERGRTIGLVLAGIGAVLALLSIVRMPASSVIQLALDVFIIWALVTNQAAFRP